MHAALKIMACRLAQQSTTYAKLLFESYRSLRDKTLEDLWTDLKFEHFDAPANSILYLCFDGLDQLKNPKPLTDVLDTILDNHRASNSGSKLKLRVILTGKDDTLTKRLLLPIIDIKELNKPIMRQYVQSGMQDIVDVKDTDTLSSSNLLVDAILTSAEGSFSAANQRLKIVEDAINEDLDFEEALERVKAQKITTDEQEGSRILAETCEALKPHYREQLKEILYWCSFGAMWPTLSLDREITASCGADATMAVVNGTKDNDRSHNDTYVSDFRWTGGCNLCNSKVSLDSRMNMEIWSCTYCPNMDFCRECHEKVKSNQSEQLMCGSEHVHVLMKHFDYDDEEVKGQNVRIGWQLVESNGGRDRQRIGGKIVTLDEWIQILRKEWDIPESKTEGRLQK